MGVVERLNAGRGGIKVENLDSQIQNTALYPTRAEYTIYRPFQRQS